MQARAGRTIAGWLALAVVLAACRHPLASPYPVPADPFDLGALLAGAGSPDQTALHPASAGPDHSLQTVLAYLGLLIAAGAAFGAVARKPSAPALRAAPHPAGATDIARQLNHDVKNGLVPVRNVFRHLARVAREEPERLPAVLLERQATVEAGIAYLETLARNYPSPSRVACDLNAIVSDVSRGLVDAPAVLLVDLRPSLPSVAADPVAMRRVVENLVSNAVESLLSRDGKVRLVTGLAGTLDAPTVRLTVTDTGRGMTRRELDRAFDDFYSTKPGGTGLGLSVVKRLVLDLSGSIRVDTAPGVGSQFTVELPVAP